MKWEDVVSTMFAFLLLKLSSSPSSFGVYAIGTAWQSSTFNSLNASLAIDSDPSTCSLTGYGSGNWWTWDLGKTTPITGVIIKGSACALNIRIGDKTSPLANRDGFDNNPLCLTVIGGLTDGQLSSIQCRISLLGRYLSLRGADNGNIRVDRLKLCDVQIY